MRRHDPRTIPAPTHVTRPAPAEPGTTPVEPGPDVLLLPLAEVLERLSCSTDGLSAEDAARRLAESGPNTLAVARGGGFLAPLVRQLTHPLALLLWVAAVLAFLTQGPTLGIAIIAVIGLNAAFALIQERHAQHAVAALSAYLPAHATVVRDGHSLVVDTVEVVPGDLLVVNEGDAHQRGRPDPRGSRRGRPVGHQRRVGAGRPRVRTGYDGHPGGRRRRRRPLRYDVHRRRGAGPRRAHRDAHRARPDRPAVPPHGPGPEPAGAPGPQGGVADRSGRGHRRRRVPAAGHAGRAELHAGCDVRHRSAGRQRPRRPPAHDHTVPGDGGERPRQARRTGQAAQRRGDAGLHGRDLHRQDRHPDPEPHARAQRLGPHRAGHPRVREQAAAG